MKFKVFSTVIVLALLMVTMNVGSVFAQAYDTPFTTSITYQNVGTAATTQLQVWFYADAATTDPIIIDRPSLAPGAGTSLFIANVNEVPQGFRGTAILVSDQPLLATLVQLPQNSDTVKNRPLSNGFNEGSPNTLLATVIKNAFSGAQNTIFSVQNVGPSATDVDIKFYNTSAQNVYTIQQTIQPGAGTFVDVRTIPDATIGSTFNGSVVVESNGGSIISSAMELQGSGIGARAFEGLGAGATEFYMPSALCNRGVNSQTTNFAIQNSSLSTGTDVTITYYDRDTGAAVGNETKSIGPGAKSSFRACDIVPSDFIGSAKIVSSSEPVIAMGKAADPAGGLFSAYVGFSSGSNKVALPYVRWATQANWDAGNNKGQRVNIAIQNIGTSDIPAGTVTIKYIDRDGVVVGTHLINDVIKAGSKVNSNAQSAGLYEFGYYYPTGAGGGALVEGPSGSELAVIARVASRVPAAGITVGEDYNGMDTP